MSRQETVRQNFEKTGFSKFGARHRYNANDKLYVVQYPHMTAFAKCAETRPTATLDHEARQQSAKHETRSWDFGVGDVAGAAQVIKSGYKKGADKIRQLAAVAPPVEGHSFNECYDVAGDEPDIDRYLSGDPENMLSRLPREETRDKVIRLFMPWAINHTWQASEFENRGAAMLTIVQALDAAGYAVELSTGTAIRCEHCPNIKYFIEKIVIKQADDHFNAERIAASLAHPAPFRRLGFATLEMDANTAPETLHAYGFSQVTPNMREAMEREPVLQGSIIIADDDRGHYTTVGQAIKNLRKIIEAQGVILGD